MPPLNPQQSQQGAPSTLPPAGSVGGSGITAADTVQALVDGAQLGDGEYAGPDSLAVEDLVMRTSQSDAPIYGIVEASASSEEHAPHPDEMPLLPGQVAVSWYRSFEGNPGIEQAADLELVDRPLLHHDVVAFRTDSGVEKTGVVVAVRVCVDLRMVVSGEIRSRVPTTPLRHLQPFREGLWVTCGRWYGQVVEGLDHVIVRLDNGTICRCRNTDTSVVQPNLEVYGDESPYFPSMRVTVFPENCSQSGEDERSIDWIRGNKIKKHGGLSGVVIAVEPGVVIVDWLGNSDNFSDDKTPDEAIEGRRLTAMSALSYTWWQLGDYAMCENLPQLGGAAGVVSASEDSGAGGASADPSQRVGISGSDTKTAVPLECPEEGGGGVGSDNDDDDESKCTNGVGVLGGQKAKNKSFWGRLRGGRGGRHKRKDHGKGRAQFDTMDPNSCGEVLRTYTEVDVMWQDRTVQQGIASRDLYVYNNAGAHDFWPEEFVCEKVDDDGIGGVTPSGDGETSSRECGTDTDIDDSDCSSEWEEASAGEAAEWERQQKEAAESGYVVNEGASQAHCKPTTTLGAEEGQRYGTVRSVDPTGRMCTVRLLGHIVNDVCIEWTGSEPMGDEEFSVYELQEHPIYQFGVTDVVVRLDVTHKSQQWIGEVVAMKDGMLEVVWQDGTTETVHPDNVYAVNHDEDEMAAYGEDDFSEGSMEDYGDIPHVQVDENGTAHVTLTTADNDQGVGAVQAALGQLTGALGSLGLSSDQSSTVVQAVDEALGGVQRDDTSAAATCANATRSDTVVDSVEGGEAVDYDSSDDECSGSDGLARAGATNTDERFLVCETAPESHHYLCPAPDPPGPQWLRAAQREWKVLKRGLPDGHGGLYVAVFEERMDLMRAMIVGPTETPYADCIFTFDILLPPNYPQEPPKLHYHAIGERLNPNLYDCGKVCLSILGTWHGEGVEMWDPKESSVFRVLLSLQALVLNSEPYYNEPGYDKQMGTDEGVSSSRLYNENALLLSLQTLPHIVRAPTTPFEGLIREHLLSRGKAMLDRCTTLIESPGGAGAAAVDTIADSKAAAASKFWGLPSPPSQGFKRLLSRTLVRLTKSFSKLGPLRDYDTCAEVPQNTSTGDGAGGDGAGGDGAGGDGASSSVVAADDVGADQSKGPVQAD